MKILTVIGARPQFVKAAVVSRAISSYNNSNKEQIREVIVHTGQHYDNNMSQVFFKEMHIPHPNYNLGICDCSHGAMTGRMLEKIESVIMKEKPDVVLVYGDTNSTLAGALAAVKLHVPVAHVEAGLRSFNMLMPEEVNRILTDRVSQFLFCPTEQAVTNLYNEGIGGDRKLVPRNPIVMNVGDVMYDAMLYYRQIAKPSERISSLIKELHDGFYIATVHREENTVNSERLKNIIEAFRDISKHTPVVFSVHPRARKYIEQYGLSLNGVNAIDPVGYFDMLILLENCRAVFTDSGGLQKEAYFFSKPCLILREETEWVELVQAGVNILVSADKEGILEAAQNLDYKIDSSPGLFGSGDASHRIVRFLCEIGVGSLLRPS
jgi:UDP-GlcNAc3NAcA epimerase